MKQLLKYTLATVCGLFIFCSLVGILFVVSMIGMMAASGSSTTQVKDNSVFVLNLNGTIEERSEGDSPMNMILGTADMSQMGLDDIVASIQKAKEEDNIKGIYIEGGIASFDAPATAQQVRDALKDFKKSGKWIIAYADQYLQASYYVASVADKVYLNKTGMIDFKGLGGKREYLKGFYDKIGVKYQAARVGKYKSYVEQNTMTGMSENDREQRTAYLQGIWGHWLKDMSESRKVSAEALNQLANDSIIGLADAKDYVKAKLVDKLMYPDEMKKELKSKLNAKEDDKVAKLSLADMKGIPSKQKEKGEEIAVYYAYGSIVDNDQAGAFSGFEHKIVGSTTVDDLNKLADDDDVKAVVLRVNSGGGSAVASEQIWHAIKQLKARKPVVVSMGGAAASGGYMISAAANYIVAEPTTITGSIGIFGLIPNFSGLVTDKLGVTFDGVKTNKYTDFEENLLMAKENSDELKYMQGYVDRGYINFLDIVADGRKMKRDQVEEIAQGRVWLATDAKKIKLVDQLGSLNDAIKKAAELAKLKEYHQKSYPQPASWMEQLLNNMTESSYVESELRQLLGDLYQPLVQLRADAQQGSRLQAVLPDDISVK